MASKQAKQKKKQELAFRQNVILEAEQSERTWKTAIAENRELVSKIVLMTRRNPPPSEESILKIMEKLKESTARVTHTSNKVFHWLAVLSNREEEEEEEEDEEVDENNEEIADESSPQIIVDKPTAKDQEQRRQPPLPRTPSIPVPNRQENRQRPLREAPKPTQPHVFPQPYEEDEEEGETIGSQDSEDSEEDGSYDSSFIDDEAEEKYQELKRRFESATPESLSSDDGTGVGFSSD